MAAGEKIPSSAQWQVSLSAAGALSLMVLVLGADGIYRITPPPATATAGFETSGGVIRVIPGSVSPLLIAQNADGKTFILT